jgi:histidinol phosphatase-like enzyme
MNDKFLEKGIHLAGFYYCPYHKNGSVETYKRESDCRKPKPGMFLAAARDLNIDLSQSVMIGDKQSDRIELPQLRTFVIKSKYTNDNYDFETLMDALSVLK